MRILQVLFFVFSLAFVGIENHLLAGHHGRNLGKPRDYYEELKEQDKKEIKYIVTTLASKSLITIAKNKSNLESAGDRIDYLHPFRFLEVVFTNEELKVSIRNIRSRGWIWNDFIGGLKNSLATEAENDNVTKEQVADFAKKLNIDPDLILPTIQKRSWDDLVSILIKHVPRNGDHSRFDQ